MSRFFTKAVAEQAVRLVLPTIKAMMEASIVERPHLHIVINEPSILKGTMQEVDWYKKGILYQYSVNGPEGWEFEYDKIARSKCHLSWDTGLTTREIQDKAAYLLEEGDTLYYGSAVSNGLVVACSGVEAYFDELFSDMILQMCLKLCTHARAQYAATEPKEGFIGKAA